jgi:hypothetical protein
MGAVSDAQGGLRAGFVLATCYAGLMLVGLAINWFANPARHRLAVSDGAA